eukprot:CAMPEP_0177163062 /NCGR_PEP_ID=MMETSP0367-20130122/6214_1 /TAXON_ID=447022 ORGANISM="Scrippsiella hangoei-like, Strain SHHI-4" /NCGR_SAMPLE_ID=MMETSP0367 /ASSEMBLY_ACC=CAM_ASM_000362 /LENGTH=535 /DNA_ID=CAMNT_0018608867 /DNA_START=30 /DNA_END=1633 /DNA_ORIENTATION=+
MAQEPMLLTKASYALAVQWDCINGKGVDLDLQAVIVDDRGVIVDAAYYNNVSAVDGAVALSGDEQSGNTAGYDESMTVNLTKLPSNVKLIIFVVAVYGKGRLKDVDNGQLVVLHQGMPQKVLRLENSQGDCDIVAMMRRGREGWELVQVEQPAEYGSHFLDILEPSIGDLIRREIPDAPQRMKVSFEMTKGAVCPLPNDSALKRLFVGIGGSLLPGSKLEVDIDISAVFVSTRGKILGAVDADNDAVYGVSHSGDQVAGEERGCGDDEAISIDLAQVPTKMRCIFLVLSVSKGDFSQIRSAYARIIDQTATELVRYDIKESRVPGQAHNEVHNGLIIGKLLRSKGRRWGFMATGVYYSSTSGTWKGAQSQIAELFEQSQELHDEQTPRPAEAEESMAEEASQRPLKSIQELPEEEVNVETAGLACTEAEEGEQLPPVLHKTMTKRSSTCPSMESEMSMTEGLSSQRSPSMSVYQSGGMEDMQATGTSHRMVGKGKVRLSAISAAGGPGVDPALCKDFVLAMDDEEAEAPFRRVCS